MAPHGVLDTYVNHRWRCLPCRAASTELATQGATWLELEHRVGACRNSIEVALTRAGRTELIGRITSNRWVAA
ncbi:hypothetical protein GA707_18620 [Nostocoides sp. F2B08]|uniref:hypothetical protein n=1 Tax=Nostocoides sp. F2B08 TaxID=2653936 RepID=UPI00126329F8|nr:hypothetical protein [Tetrasphaera sp. F2B08]KAB7740912.1 hypothetical protein GA707_18620 [Tetrasphaera sp. F2B08]